MRLRLFEIARKEALKSTLHRARLGAVVTKGGAVLSRAYNNGKHAEVAALMKLWPSERVGTTVYVVRVPNRSANVYGMARPCIECQKFLVNSRVKTVHYTGIMGEARVMRVSSSS